MKNVAPVGGDNIYLSCYDILYDIPKTETDHESIAKGFTAAMYSL
jgi:hypothetical protein